LQPNPKCRKSKGAHTKTDRKKRGKKEKREERGEKRKEELV
jgi:hypothetical protein